MEYIKTKDLTGFYLSLSSFSDERFFLLQLSSLAKTYIWLLMAGSLIVGSLAKFLLYSHILNSKIKEQPINVLIFIEQVIHHLSHFYVLFAICISLPLGISPGEMFQNYFKGKDGFCWSFFYVHMLSVIYLGLDGFGIAIVRLIYIKKGAWLKYEFGEIKLLLFTGAGIAVTTVMLMYVYGSANKSKRSMYNYCMGYNQEFQVINIFLAVLSHKKAVVLLF
jgi:hypothetical protein